MNPVFHVDVNTFFNSLSLEEQDKIFEENNQNFVVGVVDVKNKTAHINLPNIKDNIESVLLVVKHEMLHLTVLNEYGVHPEWVIEKMLE